MNENDIAFIREQMLAFDREQWEAFDAKAPTKLYHYTTRSGLKGILTSQTLWLSDFASLHRNDSTEGGYWRKLLWQLRDQDWPSSDLRRLLVDNGALEPGSVWYLYVGCTSGESRLRHQWDTYADSLRGYAIGLDYDHLLESSEKGRKYALFRVLYDQDLQAQMLRKRLEYAAQLKRHMGLHLNGRKHRRRFWRHVAFSFLRNGLRFKPQCFEREHEWRLLRSDPEISGDVRVRGRDSQSVRYVELPIQRGCVTQVIRGPRCSESKEQLVPLLEETGWCESVAEEMNEASLIDESVCD